RRDQRRERGWIFEKRQVPAVGHDRDARVGGGRSRGGGGRVGGGVAVFFAGGGETGDGVERRQRPRDPVRQRVGDRRVAVRILLFEPLDELRCHVAVLLL